MTKKVLVLLVLLSLQLFARQYDNTILDIEAKLFPKIAMLEKHIKNKDSAVLSLVIYTQEIDLEVAEKFKEKILNNYPNLLSDKKVNVSIEKNMSSLSSDIDALIVLNHSEEDLLKLTSWSNRRTILSFSYDPADLEYNVIASIHIGSSTKPYLNTTVIKEHNFKFNSYLLQLSKLK